MEDITDRVTKNKGRFYLRSRIEKLQSKVRNLRDEIDGLLVIEGMVGILPLYSVDTEEGKVEVISAIQTVPWGTTTSRTVLEALKSIALEVNPNLLLVDWELEEGEFVSQEQFLSYKLNLPYKQE